MQKQLYYQYENKLQKQIIKLCHSLELSLHDNSLGPKIYTNYQRIGLIVLFLRSRKALRDFVSELYESRWVMWLGLKEIPSKSSIHSWMQKFNLSFLRKLLFQTVEKEKPSLMAIDATGIDSWKRSRHYERRIGEAYMPYAKADVFVDTEKKLVHDCILRIKPRHDVLGAKTIFRRIKVKETLILADKGYDAEELHKIVAKSNNMFFAPIRKSSRNRPKGWLRRKAFDNPPAEKGMRSIVESVIRSLKVRINALRSRLHYMKKREFMWHVIIYNLEKGLQNLKALLKLIFQLAFLDRAMG